MLFNLFLALLLGGFATLIAYLVNRKRADSPSVPKSSLPVQIDRSDFENPNRTWLLVFFSSDTCDSCIKVRDLIYGMPLNSVHFQEVSFPKGEGLHLRYGIDSVPIILIADFEGVVVWSYAGVPSAELLGDAISNL